MKAEIGVVCALFSEAKVNSRLPEPKAKSKVGTAGSPCARQAAGKLEGWLQHRSCRRSSCLARNRIRPSDRV